jgi:hypothetical protein
MLGVGGLVAELEFVRIIHGEIYFEAENKGKQQN